MCTSVSVFCRAARGQPTPLIACLFLPISLWALSALSLEQIFLTVLLTLTLLTRPLSVSHLSRVRQCLVRWHWEEPNSVFLNPLKKNHFELRWKLHQFFFIQMNTPISCHFGYCLDERPWGLPQDQKRGGRDKAKCPKILEVFFWEKLLSPGHWNHVWT